MRRRRRSRRIVISFAGTIVALSLAVLIGLALTPNYNGVITKHIAGAVPAYSGVLADFAPSGALQVSYNNLTAIRNVNASALATGSYLQFLVPKMNLSAPSIQQRISVALSSPNTTVDVTIMDPDAFQNANSAFQNNLKPTGDVGGYPVYKTTEVSTGTRLETWIVMLPRSNAIVASAGGDSALQGVTQVISVYTGSQPSLLTDEGVQRMIYVANGTDGHLGVGIQNFPGAVTSGKMTLITVDNHQSSLWVDYFVRFSNSTQAESQVAYFQRVYLGANRYESYDEILVATEFQPISSITRAVGIVG